MKTKELLKEIVALLDQRQGAALKIQLVAKIAELMAHVKAKPEIPGDVLQEIPNKYRGLVLNAFGLFLLQAMRE
jgi:hypothetical protein